MELTYDDAEMRKLAVDSGAAKRVLGAELGEAFLGLVADMRIATFLGELVDVPTIVDPDPLLLHYPLAAGCALEVQPVGGGNVNQENWSGVHRVKLIRVIRGTLA